MGKKETNEHGQGSDSKIHNFRSQPSTYLHEHSGKIQSHDQYHGDNQDHPSTKGVEQERQEKVL